MTFSNYLIPLQNVPQKFEITLAGVAYILTCKWNDMGQFWAIDIADQNEKPIASNIPLITGEDCLAGLEYLGIQGSLYVMTNGSSPFDVPTLETLGVTSNLYFQTSVADE